MIVKRILEKPANICAKNYLVVGKHWKTVEDTHTDSKNDLHGLIERTGKMVKFWKKDEVATIFLEQLTIRLNKD